MIEENNKPVTSLVADSAADKPLTKGKKSSGKKGGQSRRKSRELVLKGLYRGMFNHTDLTPVFKDMLEDPDYRKADEAYFKALMVNVSEKLAEIDEKIAVYLDRQIAELSPIEHSILRISGYELMFDLSIPYRVAINEGVELAKIFGGVDGHKYINGVLDKLAAEVRAAEISPNRKE
jgi:transcription antitermination protein NusB